MTRCEPPTVSVVIPVYNEEGNVQQLHKELLRELAILGESFEIIYIDDGSTDRTLSNLSNLAHATIIVFSRNFGKSQALQAGIDAALGDYIITLDGDLQDDPREIPNLMARARDGADLVCGWKQKRRDPTGKRFMSKIANGSMRLATGLKIHDMNCCFKVYRRDAAKGLVLFGDMHRYIPALVAHQGYRVEEVPVNHRKRFSGTSKYGFQRIFGSLFDFSTLLLLRRFTDRPMYFFGSTGLVLSGVGLLTMGYLTFLKLVNGESIGDRPLLLLGVFLVIVGFQSLSLGFFGELMIRQQTERRHYIVRRTLKNN